MTIESNRTLGGVGACLTLVGIISTFLSVIQYAFPALLLSPIILSVSGIIGALSLVGFILIFVAMHGFSRAYNDHRIFNYILYGLIGTIISAIMIGTIWMAYVMLDLFSVIRSLTPLPNASSQIQSLLMPYISPLIIAFSTVTLIWIILNYKAYNLLADKSGVKLFRSAAKLFVLGALINIAFSVTFAILGFNISMGFFTFSLAIVPGGLVQYIAWVLAAKAFFQIR